MYVDSVANSDNSVISGNPVKFFLGSMSVIAGVIVMVQHYILYPEAVQGGTGRLQGAVQGSHEQGPPVGRGRAARQLGNWWTKVAAPARKTQLLQQPLQPGLCGVCQSLVGPMCSSRSSKWGSYSRHLCHCSMFSMISTLHYAS